MIARSSNWNTWPSYPYGKTSSFLTAYTHDNPAVNVIDDDWKRHTLASNTADTKRQQDFQSSGDIPFRNIKVWRSIHFTTVSVQRAKVFVTVKHESKIHRHIECSRVSLSNFLDVCVRHQILCSVKNLVLFKVEIPIKCVLRSQSCVTKRH
jgi:hypothetical protein